MNARYTTPMREPKVNRYEVNRKEIDLHEVNNQKFDTYNFDNQPIDIDFTSIGYVAGKHITKSPWLNKRHFKYVHEAGTFSHVIKKDSVRILIAKQTLNGKSTIIICQK